MSVEEKNQLQKYDVKQNQHSNAEHKAETVFIPGAQVTPKTPKVHRYLGKLGYKNRANGVESATLF